MLTIRGCVAASNNIGAHGLTEPEPTIHCELPSLFLGREYGVVGSIV